MHTIKYRITILSPVVITTQHGDRNMVTTEKYLPGTSVLGLLAHQVIKNTGIAAENAYTRSDFYQWFLAGHLKISHAYIICTDKYGDKYEYFPTPLSIQQEKHGELLYDLLYTEPPDEEPAKALNKFCKLDDDNLNLTDVDTSLNFHHARERETGTAQKGILFTYESLAPAQNFEGHVVGEVADLQHLMDTCGNAWTAYLGRSRNAQYGEVKFEFLDEAPVEYHPEIEWKDELSLTLLSETILYNKYGFPATDIETLQHYLGDDVTIKKTFMRTGDVETFLGIWQLRTPSVRCMTAGSTFLLDLSDCTDNTRKRLAALQINGIGERTHEGFGRCYFGWQTAEELEQQQEEETELPKPEGSLPEKTQQILKTLAQGAIKKQIELIALGEQRGFGNVSNVVSTSLLGRLETMAKQMPQNEFMKAVTDLRKTAKDKLQRCVNRDKQITLYNFLAKLKVPDVFEQPDHTGIQIAKLCEMIGYRPEEDAELQTELYQLYCITFFSNMRKRIKT